MIEDGDVVSRETAKEEFQKLFEQAVEYRKNDDYSSFCTLIRGADENKEGVDNYYGFFGTIVENDYPDNAYDVIWDNGTYYLCHSQQSLTTGTESLPRRFIHSVTV